MNQPAAIDKTPDPELFDLPITGRFIGAAREGDKEKIFGRTIVIELDRETVHSIYAKAYADAVRMNVTERRRVYVIYLQIALITVVEHLAKQNNDRYIPMAVWTTSTLTGTTVHPMYDDLLKERPDLFIPYEKELGTVLFDFDKPSPFERERKN